MKFKDLIHKTIGISLALTLCVSTFNTNVSAKEEKYSPGNSFYKYIDVPEGDYVNNFKYVYKKTTAKFVHVKANVTRYDIDKDLWSGFRDLFPYDDMGKYYQTYDLIVVKKTSQKVKGFTAFSICPNFKTQVKYKYKKSSKKFSLYLTKKAPFKFTVKVQDGNKKWYKAEFKKGSKKTVTFAGFKDCKTNKQMKDRSRKKIVNGVKVIMPTSSTNSAPKTHSFKAQYFEYRFIPISPEANNIEKDIEINMPGSVGKYMYDYKGYDENKYYKKLKKKYNKKIKSRKTFTGSLFTNDIDINNCIVFFGKTNEPTNIYGTETIDIAHKDIYAWSNLVDKKGNLKKRFECGLYK